MPPLSHLCAALSLVLGADFEDASLDRTAEPFVAQTDPGPDFHGIYSHSRTDITGSEY